MNRGITLYGFLREMVLDNKKAFTLLSKGFFHIYSPSWARTNDTAVNSRVLCQLSYGGMSQIPFSIRRKTTVCSTSFRFAQAPRLILTASQIPFSIRRKATACSLLILTASQIPFSIRRKTTACSPIILTAARIPFSLCLMLVFPEMTRG